MSISLMTSIFYTEFFDLPRPGENGSEKMTKASTAKIVLLAIADQANDEGKSAYPGFKRLILKTGLSRQGLVDTLDCLTHNGIISIAEEKADKYGTNNYSINAECFTGGRNAPQKLIITIDGSQATGLVKPLAEGSQVASEGSQATLQEVVKPLDHKPPLNELKQTTNINGSTHKFSSFETAQLKSEYMESNTVPYRKAHVMLLNVSHLPAVPRDQEAYIETVQAMMSRYGEEATKTALERACVKWISTQGKSGRNYSKTNFKWVDWAMDMMDGGGKAVDPAMKTHNELMAMIRGEA